MLYKQIAHNKRNTWILMFGFAILILLVSCFIGAIFSLIVGGIFFLGGMIYMIGMYFNATRHLMKIVDARHITKDQYPQIYEIVEELCIAANLPMPQLYIIPDPRPNAFATGRDPGHASIALTQGLLDVMDKHEIEGVVGHELSHIRNYDTRVTVIASGLVGLINYTGIGLLLFGWTIVVNGKINLVTILFKILGLMMIVVGAAVSLVGIPAAKLLFSLVSKQREYLADVGSVDLTREPSGLISALTKLKVLEESVNKIQSSQSNLMLNTLYFNVPNTKSWIQNLFADHPSLDKRIKRLENSANQKNVKL